LLAKNPRTLRGVRLVAFSLTTFASKLAPTGGSALFRRFLANVGASLLAKNPRTLWGVRLVAFSLTTVASKLVPTGGSALFCRNGVAMNRRSGVFLTGYRRNNAGHCDRAARVGWEVMALSSACHSGLARSSQTLLRSAVLRPLACTFARNPHHERRRLSVRGH
jgi:hypothetical protein